MGKNDAIDEGMRLVEQLASAGHLDRLFIDGEWVLPLGHGRAAVVDPSTEETIAEIARGNAQDVDEAVHRGAARLRRLVCQFPPGPGRAAGPRAQPDP